MANLNRFFSPQSVAVIGATERVEKIGERILRTLIKQGYVGKAHPVYPSHATRASLVLRHASRAPCDVATVADLQVKLSHLAWDARKILAEFDVNPVVVHEAGASITVIDAL